MKDALKNDFIESIKELLTDTEVESVEKLASGMSEQTTNLIEAYLKDHPDENAEDVGLMSQVRIDPKSGALQHRIWVDKTTILGCKTSELDEVIEVVRLSIKTWKSLREDGEFDRIGKKLQRGEAPSTSQDARSIASMVKMMINLDTLVHVAEAIAGDE